MRDERLSGVVRGYSSAETSPSADEPLCIWQSIGSSNRHSSSFARRDDQATSG